MQRSRPNLTIDQFAAEEAPPQVGGIAARDELASDLGYHSVEKMMEQTEIVPLPTGLFMHLTTDSDGYWVVWSDRPIYEIQRFESREAALTELRECVSPIIMQS